MWFFLVVELSACLGLSGMVIWFENFDGFWCTLKKLGLVVRLVVRGFLKLVMVLYL